MILLAAWLGCADGAPRAPPPVVDTAVEVPGCPTFGVVEVAGVVSDERIVEASGLAWFEGALWTHNDSGDAALYALSADAVVLGRLALDGVTNVDWEDIAAADDGLWVGDIGDNLGVREHVRLLFVSAPVADLVGRSPRVVEARWEGGPRDAETLLVDPVSGELLVLSKDFSGLVTVGRVEERAPGEAAIVEVASLVLGEGGVGTATLLTGGDVAPDGRGVVLRTYLEAFWYPRVPGEPWSVTFGRAPFTIPVGGEPQGEAIAVGEGAIWTLSERTGQPLHRTPILSAY